ncbi:hypothetical protein EYC84_011975 [Monilinia fructicola]|uniref:Uncharacterized protein n=1 Tax=Monilinia fructicola TaxID=38448 RepID=A0A5M9J467_MONFR|nr:hypothetical protein EYC84_011975 [Monilinia fructicola]
MLLSGKLAIVLLPRYHPNLSSAKFSQVQPKHTENDSSRIKPKGLSQFISVRHTRRGVRDVIFVCTAVMCCAIDHSASRQRSIHTPSSIMHEAPLSIIASSVQSNPNMFHRITGHYPRADILETIAPSPI